MCIDEFIIDHNDKHIVYNTDQIFSIRILIEYAY